jgi:hypothetical protein
MSASFYNTTGETGRTLDPFAHKATDQETEVLAYFVRYRHHHAGFTPSEVWRAIYGELTPLTSVRRAISNLTARGALLKTERKRLSGYGRPEHVWTLAA